ncbi:hypothetical protein LEP1GSC008_1463 [Leptospira kirschneri serovar Bulgarica str. Nikolaevo]|uniref:Uncharacterized protein n=1 Tax=Leptospira kirschneri serovar Bulgarica str. Nikolaevo TaxID=1240687 RepID=M6FFW4_9LEPT|nr:hypothetical protein LEP1GSC008_1463 [Leptospira kirschneri serovar Bulgarica str. Nikolaevo]
MKIVGTNTKPNQIFAQNDYFAVIIKIYYSDGILCYTCFKI